MTFLNGAMLAALTLGLLPILIHLLNRQRFKKVDFPTLRFLRELQRQKMRQVRIRQILLLILRTLAVLLIVLALTRPVVRSAAGILPGVDARTTAVLILDRSASMAAETPDGTRFRRLQIRAQEILELLGEGDEAQIVWADDEPAVFPEQPTTQLRLLKETVADSRVQSGGGDLTKALREARRIVGGSQNLHKEVYVVSDFSVSAWPDKLPDSPVLPDDVRLFTVPVADRAPQNIGVTGAEIVSRIITPGRPVEVRCDVRNTGSAPAEDRILSVYLGGRRVAQARTSLRPGESRDVRMKFVPDEPGDQIGYVRVEEADEFAPDDQSFFVLRVPVRLTVAVAGLKGASRTLTALALNPAADPGGFVGAPLLSPAELEAADWSAFDAIFIVDAAGFSGGFAARLRQFAETGRGVMIAPGPQADLREYTEWFTALGLPAAAGVWTASGNPLRWSQIDLQHPLFEGLFAEPPAGITPEIHNLLQVAGTASAVEVIATSAGKPFLLESHVGRGRVLLLTSSPDPTWSSLYRSGIFPPLMVSTAAYLAGIGTAGADYQFFAGQPAQLRFPGIPAAAAFELRGAQSLVPLIETAPVGYVVKFPGIAAPGAYELWQGNRRMAAVAVNIPTRESALELAPETAYQAVLGGKRTVLDERSNIESAIHAGRFGRELWKLCLYIALAALLAEMLIGRVGKREAIAV